MWLSARGDDAILLAAGAILVHLVVVVVQKQKWEGCRGSRRHLHCKTMVIVTANADSCSSCSSASTAGICGLGPEQLNVIIVVDFRQFRIFAVREELRHEVVQQAVPLVDDLAEEVLQVADSQLGLLPRGPTNVHQLATR